MVGGFLCIVLVRSWASPWTENGKAIPPRFSASVFVGQRSQSRYTRSELTTLPNFRKRPPPQWRRGHLVTILHASFYGRRRGLFPKRLCLSRPQAAFHPKQQRKRLPPNSGGNGVFLRFGSLRRRLTLAPPVLAEGQGCISR